jgi:CHRD domain-containing protein
MVAFRRFENSANWMKRSALTIVLLVLSLRPAAAQNEVRYKVRLAPVPMDIAMRSTVAGSGSATAVLKGTSLTINGTFEGLRSSATAARLHQGPTMGLRGMPFADLMISKATSGTISGSVALTPEQARALERGRLYLQISSERAPDGNLWGWFVR